MASASHRISTPQRRSAIRGSFWNAIVWAIGNGMVSTTLITYLALELGARGLAISGVLAAPRLSGVLRLYTPWLFAWGQRRAEQGKVAFGRKPICLTGYALSGVVLLLIPFAATDAGAYGRRWGLGVLVAAWCVYHLLEYVSTVALWSWLGDLYPRRLRNRLVGHRERWLVIGRVIGIVASFLLTLLWNQWEPDSERWQALAASASVGALFMMLAIVPLARMPSFAWTPSATPAAPFATLVAAIRNPDYRRLLAYSCTFAVANGVTATAQGMYPWRVLGIGYRDMLVLRSLMRVGQAGIAPACGAWLDRLGPGRLLGAAQLVVATGPLFFFFAHPAPPWYAPWLIAGAFLAWVAYAPINVGLGSLKIGYADEGNNAPYVAVYHAVSDLVNAATIIAGGLIYDALTQDSDQALGVYATLFLIGWLCRSAVAWFAVRLRRPMPGGRTPDVDRLN